MSRDNHATILYSPTARAGLPVNPASNLQNRKLPKDCENPAPSVKSMNMGAEIKYTSFRPYRSDSGAERIGPNPRPSVYSERPNMATVRET